MRYWFFSFWEVLVSKSCVLVKEFGSTTNYWEFVKCEVENYYSMERLRSNFISKFTYFSVQSVVRYNDRYKIDAK